MLIRKLAKRHATVSTVCTINFLPRPNESVLNCHPRSKSVSSTSLCLALVRKIRSPQTAARRRRHRRAPLRHVAAHDSSRQAFAAQETRRRSKRHLGLSAALDPTLTRRLFTTSLSHQRIVPELAVAMAASRQAPRKSLTSKADIVKRR